MSDSTGSNSSNDGYKNIYAQLYVPSTSHTSTELSADLPGAYFRLGGYSDIEFVADADDDLGKFYPRKHIDAEGDDALANAPGSGSSESGILLACNGRLLVQAAEKVYIASTKAMSIDSADTLTITADGEIDVTSGDQIKITSGTNKDITISAGGGTGNVTTNANTHTVNVLGEKYTKVTKDTYSFFQADSYAITMGRQTSATFGGRFALWVGASFSFNTSVDVTVALLSVNMWMLLRVNIGTATFDLFNGKFTMENWKIVTVGAKVENDGAQVQNVAANVEDQVVNVRQRALSLDNAQLNVGNRGLDVGGGGPRIRAQSLDLNI